MSNPGGSRRNGAMKIRLTSECDGRLYFGRPAPRRAWKSGNLAWKPRHARRGHLPTHVGLSLLRVILKPSPSHASCSPTRGKGLRWATRKRQTRSAWFRGWSRVENTMSVLPSPSRLRQLPRRRSWLETPPREPPGRPDENVNSERSWRPFNVSFIRNVLNKPHF